VERHVLEAREVDVVVDDAFVVVFVEPSFVAVRAAHVHLLERLHELLPCTTGLPQCRCENVHEVVRVHRVVRRRHNLATCARPHADALDAVRRLVLRLERIEEARPELRRHPAGCEGETVQPFGPIGELLAEDRLLRGRRRVDRHLPVRAAGRDHRLRDRRAFAPDEQRGRTRTPRAEDLGREIGVARGERQLDRDRFRIRRERVVQRVGAVLPVRRVVVK
jgi:hypothetical protein